MDSVLPMHKGVPLCEATTRQQWRQWLERNHQTAASVWLVYYKPTSGKTRVSYPDAVEEALCFGWIDSKPNKLDEHRSLQFFAPRNPKSSWSRINKERVERLTAEGRMMPAGLKLVELARKNGAWNKIDEVEDGVIPADLELALKEQSPAEIHFVAFPKSVKKSILNWILEAKTPATREKRVQQTAAMAAENQRANQYNRKGLP